MTILKSDGVLHILKQFVSNIIAQSHIFSYSSPYMKQAALQKILHQKLIEARVKNPSFSLRAYARRLRINSGALSAILNGKRPLTQKTAHRLADGLGLDPQERAEIMAGFQLPYTHQVQSEERTLKYLQLTADQFRLIASWQHFAILSLINTSDFQSDSQWIAMRLGISKKLVVEALTRLERLGMVEFDSQGTLSRTKSKFRTQDDVANISLRQSHSKNLELAAESLVRDPIEVRDFTAATMAINPEKLPKAKEMIRKFQDELIEFLESGDQSEVYKVCMQLFPLTQRPKKDL